MTEQYNTKKKYYIDRIFDVTVSLALRTEEPSPIENIPRVHYIGKKIRFELLTNPSIVSNGQEVIEIDSVEDIQGITFDKAFIEELYDSESFNN